MIKNIIFLCIFAINYTHSRNVNEEFIQTTPFVESNVSQSMHIIGGMAGNSFGLCKLYKSPFKLYFENENKTKEISLKKFKLMPSVGYVNNRLIYSFVPAFVSKIKINNDAFIIDSQNRKISLISKPYEIECIQHENTVFYDESESTVTTINKTVVQTRYIYTIACYTEYISGEKYMFNNSLNELNIILNKNTTLDPVILLKTDEENTRTLRQPLQYGVNITIYKGYNYNNKNANDLVNRITIVGYNIDNIVHSVEEFYLKTLLLQNRFINYNCYKEYNMNKKI